VSRGQGGRRGERGRGGGPGSIRIQRRLRHEQHLSHVYLVTPETVGPSDCLNPHAETTRQAVECIPPLYSVQISPTQRRPTRIRLWRGSGIEGRRQIDLLARGDDLGAQTVSLHESIRRHAGPPGQAGERVSLLHGVDEPPSRLRATGDQMVGRGRSGGRGRRRRRDGCLCRPRRRGGRRRGDRRQERRS
jgi:hypothetical protein